jgi:hypothetical protein
VRVFGCLTEMTTLKKSISLTVRHLPILRAATNETFFTAEAQRAQRKEFHLIPRAV